MELLQQIEQRRAIVVENKADLAGSTRLGDSDGVPRVRTSALTGEGVAELREEILRTISGDAGVQPEAAFLTNMRQAGLVENSVKSLDAAAVSTRAKVPHEMILLDLYGALRSLDEITGATTADDILNLIFGSFCIGK
jgi:tRNA modification GTPase